MSCVIIGLRSKLIENYYLVINEIMKSCIESKESNNLSLTLCDQSHAT